MPLTAPSTVRAQLTQVLELNRQGMEAYTNLELEQAMSLLQEALQAAQVAGVEGSPLARTYINLGVVSIGGFQDNAQGLQHFVAALQADASVQLDPLTSSPDIQSVMTLAKNRVRDGGGAGSTAPLPDSSGVGPTGDIDLGLAPGSELPPGTIPHRPVDEQLKQTAIPIFVEAPDDAPVGSVFVYYKAPGMRDFRRSEMRRMPGGFGIELPCSEVHAPEVAYYLVGFGEDNSTPIGVAGSPEQPYLVRVVDERTMPPPALPGAVPPEQCVESECPPGMPGCNDGGGSAGLGDTCRSTSECRTGLVCEDEFCVVPDEDDDPDDEGGFVGPRVFADVGFSLGLGYATANRPADSAPPPDANPADPQYGAYEYQPSFPDCAAQMNEYCVRLEQPGFLLAPALRFTVGVYIIQRLAVAGTVRFQLNSGQGTLANLLLGLRLSYDLTEPTNSGLLANIHLGSSYGQIQLQPPQNGAAEPYIISGLNGIQVGGTLGYRILKHFGVVLTPEVHIMVPTFLFAIDLTLSAQVGF